MTKSTEKFTASEFVWIHRMRQRIAFEQIVLTAGKPRERLKAKQFLEAMEKANPALFEDIEPYTLELRDEDACPTPELFDDSEYCPNKGRKTALKLPKDIRWEERVIRRASREYRDLFHPCEAVFDNAMKGLQFLHDLHPELFSEARTQAIEQKEQILSFEIYCKCDCATPEDSQPADSFKVTDQGRLAPVSKRISLARQALKGFGDNRQEHWTFFLDRVKEIAPEMLQG